MVRMCDERGFSLVELMIALLVSLAVLGSATTIIKAVQNTYAYQMDDATVEEEERFAMDWIRRVIEPAGGNPYGIIVSSCPAANTRFQGIKTMGASTIRVQADVGRPDGLLVGSSGNCTQPNEDVEIALDSANKTITRYDRGADAGPVAWTDGVFTNLQFAYFDSAMVATVVPANVRVVRVTLTGRSRTPRPGQSSGATYTLQSNIRLKSQ